MTWKAEKLSLCIEQIEKKKKECTHKEQRKGYCIKDGI